MTHLYGVFLSFMIFTMPLSLFSDENSLVKYNTYKLKDTSKIIADLKYTEELREAIIVDPKQAENRDDLYLQVFRRPPQNSPPKCTST